MENLFWNILFVVACLTSPDKNPEIDTRKLASKAGVQRGGGGGGIGMQAMRLPADAAVPYRLSFGQPWDLASKDLESGLPYKAEVCGEKLLNCFLSNRWPHAVSLTGGNEAAELGHRTSGVERFVNGRL